MRRNGKADLTNSQDQARAEVRWMTSKEPFVTHSKPRGTGRDTEEIRTGLSRLEDPQNRTNLSKNFSHSRSS